MQGSEELLAFNRGTVSRLALARLDLKRMAMSADEQTNWMPRSLGSMMLRPGWQYLTSTNVDAAAKLLPFVFAADDTALLELTNATLRVHVNDVPITRVAVSSAVTNGTFDANVTGWTDADEGTAASVWVTGGYMGLTGTGTDSAIRRQEVTVAGADQGDRHALRIVIGRGPVVFRCGSTSGGEEYIAETSLETGTHSLAFTPTGNFWLEFSNKAEAQKLVDSVAVEGAGVMSVATPWPVADLKYVRWAQSADVMFVACRGYQQRRIERRGSDSWSVVEYKTEDGPFRIENTSTVTLAPSVLTGNGNLTASKPIFRQTHIGSLWRVSSVGQRIDTSFTAQNTFSNPIRVAGIGEARRFSISISGTFVATLTLQRSIGDIGSWEDVTTYTAATDTTYNDALDNQIIYYRIGVKTGNYTSGTAVTILNYSSGSITGIGRVLGFTSATVVTVEVVRAFGGTTASDVWAEGAWSDYRGHPSAVSLHEGRLWWAGRDKFYGSVTDSFHSFDPDIEGDAGTISRSIGSGPVDEINWLLPMSRLLAGTDSAVLVAKSTSFDEPLTPTNFNVKEPVTQGVSPNVQALKVDSRALFVHLNERRLYEVSYNIQSNDYEATDLTILAPDICDPGVVSLDVQRHPDTRIHCVLSDGTAAVMIYDPAEDVRCWVKVETDGDIEDVCVLPGAAESYVYYVVNRTINATTKRYIEKWSFETAGVGGTANRLADSWISATATAGAVPGLSHLQAKSVVVWGDSRSLGTYTVAAGAITLSESYTGTVIVGLSYEARFKSTKLAYMAQQGKSALGAKKRIDRLGLVMADVHASGIKYGRDFTTMDDLPLMEQGAEVDSDTVHDDYEEPSFEFEGDWMTDARLCLKATAPKPCTVLAAIIDMRSNSK